MLYNYIKDGRDTMVRMWRFANVAACRAVSDPVWCRIFRGMSFFSPLNVWTLFRCCVRGQCTLVTLTCFTWLLCKLLHHRTEMAICAMRRNGCRTVLSPWSWNGTRTIRCSDQWVDCKRRLMKCYLTATWIFIFNLPYVVPIHKYKLHF